MHIVFLNPQGNFDRKDSYWTEHPDFGGQLVYVKELAIAIAKQGHRVDIITRKVADQRWQEFTDTFDNYPDVKEVRILRIPCGPKEFLPKEELWPYLDQWVEGIYEFYNKEGEMPDFVTTHYGDGGIVGCLLKEKTGIPFSFTAHSLGAQKMDKMGIHKDNYSDYDSRYHFTLRLMAERYAMLHSTINFVSTRQEMKEQYTHPYYIGAGDQDNPSKFEIVPPGANTKIFTTNESTIDSKIEQYYDDLMIRDICEDRRVLPAIVCSSRLDAKKYHKGLVEAYAKDDELQRKMNLVIVLRGVNNPFKDYQQLSQEEQVLMDKIMQLINKYGLTGKVTFANIQSQRELASFYRTLSKRKSIFALTAKYEPFGLAPIEAMACGLPVVVTDNGGPIEVLKEDEEDYGVLVNVKDITSIQKGLKISLDKWKHYHEMGIRRVKSKYTWEIAAKHYIDAISNKLEIKKDLGSFEEIKALLKGELQLDLVEFKERIGYDRV